MEEPEQSREQRVIATFVSLADTLSSDYEVSELLRFLVARCGEALEADTAGVVIEDPDGRLRLAAALSEEMHAIEEAELSADEGPCIEAYRLREPVIIHDLEACQDRWPVVTPRLLELGMRAGHAFPLILRDDCIGALNLYRRDPGEFGENEIRLARAFADVAAIGILQQRTVAQAEERAEQLQHALNSRIIIEQAKGVLVERHQVTPSSAFEAMRGYARRNHLKIHEVSRRVVQGAAQVIPD